MKKFAIALLLVAGTFAAKAQAPAPTPAPAAAPQDKNAPQFKFTNGETHDFGTVPEGPAAVYEFEFKNTGKEPLIIQEAHASCGCTTPSYSKDPVLPGKKGKITVQYNTQGRPGPFTKTIFITSNAMPTAGKDKYEIYIKGTVTPSAQPTPAPGSAPVAPAGRPAPNNGAVAPTPKG